MNINDGVSTFLMGKAERELGAFMSAVAELYGPSQAWAAAEDWIYVFESASEPFGFTHGNFRQITVIAASRLATRVVNPGYRATCLKDVNAT